MDTDKQSRERGATRRPRATREARMRDVEDAAQPIVSAILKVVPATRWAFARVSVEGEVERLLPVDEAGDLGVLARELKRHRDISRSGPRIAATLGPLGDCESGVTLLFADERSTFGILMLLRSAEFGTFTSTEIRMLTLALGTTTDHLALLRLHTDDVLTLPILESRRETSGQSDDSDFTFYVLDRDCRIVLALDSEDERRIKLTGLQTRTADRLPAVLEQTVRELTDHWDEAGDARGSRWARPVPFLIVRTASMAGPSGSFVGVRIDRFRAPNSLTSAAAKFHISPREIQVLALLLDGRHLNEIGTLLHITSSTVQDHVRSMVEKTGSRNRSDLIARILGWEFAPAAT
jgi:DNA-binding CsgD family transcriptional regulator